MLEIFKRLITFIHLPIFSNDLNDTVLVLLKFISDHSLGTFESYHTLGERDDLIIKDIPLRPTIDSNLIIAKDPKFLRLLSTDQCLVLPSKTPLRLLVTSNDVIHSWAIPSYGVKLDAVPGRINQQLLNIPLTGTSWGQCSELCGVNHAYMPIEVKVLSFGDFLFFMELKVKEMLFPYMMKYYKLRLNMIINFCEYLRDVDGIVYAQPYDEPVVMYKSTLYKILNVANVYPFVKK